MVRRHRKPVRGRRLLLEALETRRLLVVGDVAPEVLPQNFANPEDTNHDGAVSPADALIVINELNNGHITGVATTHSTDVDGDGVVSPRDALIVINRVNSGSPTSSVPPQERAIGLRKALEAGFLPLKMTLADAQEMLETLERGGHYEAGERYRNGQMINLDQPLETPEVIAEAESDAIAAPLESAETPAASSLLEPDPSTALDEIDPFALLESAGEVLAEALHDPTLWRAVWEAADQATSELGAHLPVELLNQLADQLASEVNRQQIEQIIAQAFESGDQGLEIAIRELAELQGVLGDTNSQVARLFANLDVGGILDQVRVDLGTLAEAILASGRADAARPEPELTRLLRRDYLAALGGLLP